MTGQESVFGRRENIDVEMAFEHEGISWDCAIGDINNGFCVRLRAADKGAEGGPFLLDYDFDDLSMARLHAMPGADDEVSTGERLNRLALWAKAIRAYDALMAPNIDKTIPTSALKTLLSEHKIPRLEHVVAPTNNANILRLMNRFGAPTENSHGSPSILWSDMLSLANREKWV